MPGHTAVSKPPFGAIGPGRPTQAVIRIPYTYVSPRVVPTRLSGETVNESEPRTAIRERVYGSTELSEKTTTIGENIYSIQGYRGLGYVHAGY